VNGETVLIIPCETATRSVIPAVRALIAKELMEKHGLKQNEVAELLGISQSAVSKYATKARGYVIRIDQVREIRSPINEILALVSNGTYERTAFIRLFCQTCVIVRQKGLMCEFCQKSDPAIEIEECDLCVDRKSRRKKG